MSPRVRESIEINASPETVWALVMDPERLGDWVSAHRQVRDVPELPLAPGATFEQTLCVGGKSFDVDWKLVRSEQPKLAVWEAAGPRKTHADVRYELSGDGERTRFAYVNDFSLPGGPLKSLAGGIAGPPAKRAARRSLRALKSLLERA